jgi:uncharacterized membrane protein
MAMFAASNPLELVTDPLWPWSLPYIGLLPLLVVALVLIGLTIGTYLGAAGATRRRVLMLVALRLAALMLAFLVLLRPSLAFRDDLHVPSTLILALDASESMTIQDEYDGQSRWAALLRTLRDCRPTLDRLRDRNNVNVVLYRFGADIADFDPDGKADGKRTDVGQMLQALLERHRTDRNLRGLIVLSDGADNGTRFQPLPLAAQWRSLPCPVSAVGFGKPTTSEKQSDIALVAINPEPSPVAVKGELTVKGTIDAPGFENAKVRVQVLFDDQEVAAQDETLSLTTGNEVKVKCTAPAKPGEIKVTMRVQKLPGEVSEANNEISTYVTVTKEGLSVLLVDKLRTWEPQLICDALRNDPRNRGKEPSVHLYTVWLRGNQPLDAVQVDLFQFDKQRYDVIILGDITADRLKEGNPNALAAIYRLVSEKGAGLVMIGGLDNYQSGSWRGTEIEKLLPVQLQSSGQPVNAFFKMVPTEAGLRHYLLRLADNPQENEALWKGLADLQGRAAFGEVKPGATVLACAGDSNGPPILVSQDYDNGRTLAFACDTTYLWRIDNKGVAAHARFWKQMVRWLAKQEEVEGNLRVTPDTRRLAAGGKLGFSVTLRGKSGVDLKDAQFESKVIDPQGATAAVATAREKEEDRGTFWRTDLPGEYKLVVTGRGKDVDGSVIDTKDKPTTVRFLVYQDDAELARRSADHDFLKKLAATGGGEFLRPEELTGFLKRLEDEPVQQIKPRTNAWPEWKRNTLSQFLVWFFLLFVGLLSLEWFLRRRWGLV